MQNNTLSLLEKIDFKVSKVSKNLARYTSKNNLVELIKVILLNHQNNYIRHLSIMNKIIQSFDILAT